MEFYKKSDFFANGICDEFNQDNFSCSQKNVLRGLHFQKKPYEQAKLIKCLKGKILDVVVDLRPNSKTFKKYLKFELSQEDNKILYIPKGFAHGLIALEDETIIMYKTSCEYNSSADFGIKWDDETLKIDWGIDFEPILSQKDKNLPLFNEVIKKGLLT